MIFSLATNILNGTSIELKDILKKAKAEFVNDEDEADIDLSLENLEKDTILNLLK